MRSLGSSHTHSSQHFPGSLTLLGKGQSGLGRRTSMLHRGTQPTAPSRQVHWYLQLLWKDSPLRYTDPPKTQGAPSLAAGEEERCRGQTESPRDQNCACQGGELGSGLQGAGWKQLQTRAFLLLEGVHAGRERGGLARGLEQGLRVLLTSAHSDLAVGRGAEVAEEALVWVARVTLGTQFS